ncbi:heat shock protein 90 [[Clostridium] sordellii]|uniref:Heat shock protein 90 (Heat shock protein HtpG)(High temperature protein G) n=1 Tax=Paraclostridium sordellii TaxID=1505 RepID=A0ABP1XSQ2_PARSO|nr:molecular chaperone HtpG [Paeniclostridium sordellii]CEJ73024.1 Heat shock protein 90 (Heat shock protein HtpG)(High temperature protein G) [[Clostridium] sordellii] [Paeniclostridium sordellii]CEN68577.1 heat shock protein 90 [[Clostridium] sordellii] [Paeniclostridium sordellii]CEN71844.1 heat shock protein 90 [[Clostridium] sordellii] [Paeniclostridium sordellii]CEO22489.1 heat shock protein 90 [[Clostridium] sordellii] [Paeniclostridium sordellii]CEP76563.1 heat shock protein 90 [[Clost
MENKRGNISIHTENIFPIIKKWLYSDKDIFIRELISNGCDAINKYKKLVSLGEVKNSNQEEYKIDVTIDKENQLLIFEDNGIGMTEEEVEKYINQVAFSGAEDFVNKYKDKVSEESDIIGHFGLGFYSAFMVAKKVQIDTLSYKENEQAVRWISEGQTEYEIGQSDSRKERGTTITLFLDEDSKEFLEEYEVRNIIDKYCSFLPVDIYLHVKGKEEKEEDEKTLNDTYPLWLKSPKDCTDEEYKEFYRKVFKTFDEPLFWIHLNVDYPFNLKGILYFPKLKNEFELIEGKVKLYNNQVFVADNIKEVIPEFLLLLKGVIDCPDLPLNVSRSFLQNDKDVSKISKHIVKKVADKLKALHKNEKENYEKFWDDIQVFIKFGCLKDESFYDKIKDIILYKTINNEYLTLNEYLENCKEKHENKVFYVSDEEQQSQYIKLFKDYNLDAVILDSTIDNHFMSFIEYKNPGVVFNRIDADLSEVLKDKKDDENKEEKVNIENLFKEVVGDKVKAYSVESLKSEDTTAIILVSEQSRRMAEMKSQFAGMDLGMNFEEEKTLVINDNSPIIKKLMDIKDDESKKDKVSLICNQILDIALLANKELDAKELDEFIKRNNKLINMVISL